jgi:hypothetical protein
MKNSFGLVGLLCLVLFCACSKTTERIVPNNEAPYYDGIPTVLIENYVNRIYIDLLGREPIDSEMVIQVQFLRDGSLSMNSRSELIQRLQTDTQPAAGDSSYTSVYFKRLYEQMKVRLIEGASDGYMQGEIGIIRFGATVDSLNGDTAAYNRKMAEIAKFQRVIDSQWHYRAGNFNLDSMCAYMVNNPVYDFINMNSFNFINATFDNLYFRFPSQSEFERAYQMVDGSQPASLFGMSGTHKDDYINIIVAQREFWQGLIVWAYKTMLARDPNTTELYEAMKQLYVNRNFHETLRLILMTDEYANFR